MRKWIDIIETQATGNTSRFMAKTFENVIAQAKDFEVVADWDAAEYTLLRLGDDFLLRNEEGKYLAYYKVVMGEYAEIIHAYVIPETRGKRLTEKFCWFLQTREGKKIMFGDRLSPDARKLADSLAQSRRFHLFWINGDQKERYSVGHEPEHDENGEPIGPMALDKPTGWRLIAENEGVGRFPHFNKDIRQILAETYCLFDHY